MKTELFYDFDEKGNEKPLETRPVGGGFCSILEKVGCIGDSLASGEFESLDANGNRAYHDMFHHSWGQYMARECGFVALNFSRGGMTAKEYLESFGEQMGYFAPDLACKVYIIALGVNDVMNARAPIGSVDDPLDSGTFAGYYAELVRRYKEISPDAKFFFVTMPRHGDSGDSLRAEHAKILHAFTEKFANSYVIDLFENAPIYDSAFYKKFFLGGHMTPCGYKFTASMFISYIDYIIRHNMDDFKQLGFIGTEFSYIEK